MKNRPTRKFYAVDLLVSPPPTASSNRSTSEFPKHFKFNLGLFNTVSSSKKNAVASSTSELFQATGLSPHQKTLSTISELKEMASSRLDSTKRQLDRSHLEIFKDIEASQSRPHKRLKFQTQSCQQVMNEAEKEYKKMSERFAKSREAMKASYLEFLAEAQDSASYVHKTSIPELSHSFEKALDVLQRHYGIQSAV